MVRCVLYRVFDKQGSLLYVGATTNPATRIADHQRHQPWWDDASSITMEHFDTPESLVAAETSAIAQEAPRYNVVYSNNPNQRVSARKSRRQQGSGTLFRRADGYWVAGTELTPGPNGKRRFKRFVRRDRAAAQLALAQFVAKTNRSAG